MFEFSNAGSKFESSALFKSETRDVQILEFEQREATRAHVVAACALAIVSAICRTTRRQAGPGT